MSVICLEGGIVFATPSNFLVDFVGLFDIDSIVIFKEQSVAGKHLHNLAYNIYESGRKVAIANFTHELFTDSRETTLFVIMQHEYDTIFDKINTKYFNTKNYFLLRNYSNKKPLREYYFPIYSKVSNLYIIIMIYN